VLGRGFFEAGPGKGRMLIAQISDTHILAKASDGVTAASRAENLRLCVADINRQAVDAVIHTGDSVQNGTAEDYAYLREILAELDAPYFLVPGNRDRRDTLRHALDHLAYLPANGDFLHYVIEDYPLRLVALDSVDAGERKGRFCTRRLDWLERTLAREPDRPTVLFLHHPPFDIAWQDYMGGYRHQEEADNLAAAVSRHPQVVRVLCGHVHCLHRETWGGTIATTMPSVAVDVRKGVEEAIGAAPLYLLHTFSHDEGLVSHPRVVIRCRVSGGEES
jgi:3',5'-cyclic-AMP phosphodiesterase